MTARLTLFSGAFGGVLGGLAGMAGPPVIMLYMSSTKAVSVIRANILLYLLLADILMIVMMGTTGLLEFRPVVIGAVLAVPYLMANIIGGYLFRPSLEKLYRALAYFLIAGSAIINLPLFGLG